MSEWIDQQITRFNNPDEPWGKRWHKLTEEIANQRDVVDRFQKNAIPDVPGESFAKCYLGELEKARDSLLRQVSDSKEHIDLENQLVYWSVHTAIERERVGYTPAPLDLAAFYQDFREKYFDNKVPVLSESFVCCFTKLPFDASGICYLEKDAARIGVRPGIRINEKLRDLPAEAKVVLLHEMVHASGTRKHDSDFKLGLVELFGKGAYLDPLIL